MTYRGIFDTHAHYDDAQFDCDRDELLKGLPGRGVCAVINCGCTLASSKAALALSARYPFVYCALGIHPEELDTATDADFDALVPLYQNQKVVAVGEIGLDYHWDVVPRAQQMAAFERQLILANDLRLPVIIHDRDAHADTFELLRKHRPQGVLHCFSGSVELAKEALSLGLYIGLGGVVTFKNARKAVEVAAMLPDDRLLLETDAPYMAPVPFRGKRNDSSLIAYSAERLGEIRGEAPQAIIDRCKENAERLFFKSEA